MSIPHDGIYEALLDKDLQILQLHPELRSIFGKLDPEEEPARSSAFLLKGWRLSFQTFDVSLTIKIMGKGMFCAGLMALLINGSLNLIAGESSGSNPTAAMPFAILSPADKERFLAARSKALDENPDLKAEGEDLKKQQDELEGSAAAPEEKHDLSEKVTAHQQKLREIMLQDDPTLQPIFDQFDKRVGEMRAEAKKKVAELYAKTLAEKRAQRQNSTSDASTPGDGAGSGNSKQ
jgi:hypothetical protein